MQIKFLTVALATALTATLTGCGSDGDSNYNKQDVAPVDFGAEANAANAEKVKELQDAVKKSTKVIEELQNKVSELEEKAKGSPSTGGNTPETVPGEDRQPETEQPTNTEGSNPTNTEGSNPTNPEGGNPTNTDTAQPTKPVVKDPVHNVNNAAHEGSIDEKEVVVVQNYVRGANAQYDRTPNPEVSNNGNASVIGYNTLDNPAMSNIVLARPEKNGSKKTIFVGTDAEDAKGYNFDNSGKLDLGNGKADSLQMHNISDVTKNESKVIIASGNKLIEDIANDNDQSSFETFAKDAYQSGLVRTFSVGEAKQTDKEFLKDKENAKNAARFIVRGQEEQIINIKDGKVAVLHETGFDKFAEDVQKVRGARMFGSLYHANGTKIGDNGSNQGDVPQFIWNSEENKFIENKPYSGSNTTKNSWQFTAKLANDAKLGVKESAKAQDEQPAKNDLFKANLAPKEIHLNHVQYGRVTINADKTTVDKVIKDLDSKTLTAFSIDKPFKYTDGQKLTDENKNFTQVNTYFARGNWATQPNEMPSEGKVTYLGHALAYGLDNSLHKGHNLNSNTVTLPKREGIGNFVRAEADFANSKVTGSIYNVWTPDLDSLGQDAFEDTLVTFDGNITKGRNSVVGTSKLAYGNQEEGAFKGAFYGPKADEFAGSVNSVTEGYGPAKWGAVFGAQAVRPPAATPTTGIDSSIEATAGAGN